MTVRQLLPESLGDMSPGPQLAAALADLDLSAVAGSDLIDVLQAQARQLAHEQARLLTVMAEVGWRDPRADPDKVARLTELPPADDSLVPAADEIRAALAWTRAAAYREYHFAQSLTRRLPAVFTALDQGRICRSKAWLFNDLCATLTDEQAEVVAQRLLPEAGRLTTGELAARIKKTALALDPEWAARRYRAAVRDRDVIGYLDEVGTATVTGRRLPADQAAAACARIEDLARAAKRTGYPGRIGPLRADIYLGLLDGRWAHHSREEIINDLIAHATPAEASCDGVVPPVPTDDEPPPPAVPEPDIAAETERAPETERAGSGDLGRVADATAEGDGAAGGTTPVGSEGRGAGAAVPDARVGVELRVGLSTLLGLDRHPGEVPGWGPVTAETARALAAAQHHAEWRYAITDPQGQLVLGGLTRRRPNPPEDTGQGCGPGAGQPTTGRQQRTPLRGGIVELHVPASLLADLATHPGTYGRWAAVISDLATQYQAFTTGTSPDTGQVGRQDPAARFAGAVLRRHVQIRDRFCVFLGCRCSARHADLDHTLDHSHRGPTTHTNSGPLCKHDHLLKHDGGWRLSQPQPGHFHWISPLGRHYYTRPQPITNDLPDPVPGPGYPDYPLPPPLDEDEPILSRPPPEPQPPPVPPPTPAVDPDESPPF